VNVLKILVDERVDDLGHKASVFASELGLPRGNHNAPVGIEYRGRVYSHPWRLNSADGEFEGYRFRTDDSLYTFTVWND
jgi:hypothetical protein